jgi:hypothetical protein
MVRRRKRCQTMMQRNIEKAVLIMGMVLWGANSDRTGERLRHTILLFALAALGWTIVVLSAIPEIRLTGLILVSVGAFTGMALFWAFCTPLLTLEQEPASIALISTAGFWAPRRARRSSASCATCRTASTRLFGMRSAFCCSGSPPLCS